MASRPVESGIPRTYGSSMRLAGHGVDAIVRAKIGFGYALGHSVGTGIGKGVRAAKAKAAAAKAHRAELAAARNTVTTAAKHSNVPIVVGAVAGLAMVGAGLALLKYRAAAKPEPAGFEVDEGADDLPSAPDFRN